MNQARQNDWDMPQDQLLLKKVLVEANLSQRQFGPAIGVSPGLINLCCNKNRFPRRIPDFKERVEKYLLGHPSAMEYLKSVGKEIGDIWESYAEEMTRVMPADHSKRCNENPIKTGNPLEIVPKEVAMLSPAAMKHFKLFRNPFTVDVRSEEDIYMSEEHRYINAAMMDAAMAGGLIAVIGQVGSGKTVIRKKIAYEYKRNSKVTVIYPQAMEINRIKPNMLGDAIICDISKEKPEIPLEAKGRQVRRLLQMRHAAGYRHVLLIEEAHLLSNEMLKFLKQLNEYESEDGYSKMVGVVLIAQNELRDRLDEGNNPGLRELIRRLQVANIRGLNGNLKDYLEFKFKRFKIDIEKIITDEALEVLSNRLVELDGSGKKVSTAVPLTVNNMIVDAMNLAVEMDEELITDDVIQAL